MGLLIIVVAVPVSGVDDRLDLGDTRTVTCYEAGKYRLGRGERLAARP